MFAAHSPLTCPFHREKNLSWLDPPWLRPHSKKEHANVCCTLTVDSPSARQKFAEWVKTPLLWHRVTILFFLIFDRPTHLIFSYFFLFLISQPILFFLFFLFFLIFLAPTQALPVPVFKIPWVEFLKIYEKLWSIQRKI